MTYGIWQFQCQTVALIIVIDAGYLQIAEALHLLCLYYRGHR